jgi:hypothetical protein
MNTDLLALEVQRVPQGEVARAWGSRAVVGQQHLEATSDASMSMTYVFPHPPPTRPLLLPISTSPTISNQPRALE